jgi:hypothetical protein
MRAARLPVAVPITAAVAVLVADWVTIVDTAGRTAAALREDPCSSFVARGAARRWPRRRWFMGFHAIGTSCRRLP